MFSSVGWGEILGIIVLALILIDPEKFPAIIKDIRAAIFAARKAINNAKKELDGELGEEFEEFKKPLGQLAQWQRMGPRAALTKALFDEDENFLDDFDPTRIMKDTTTAGQAHRQQQQGVPTAGPVQPQHSPQPTQAPKMSSPSQPPQPPQAPADNSGGFSWEDVT